MTWASFLAEDPATRSCTSICLKLTAGWFTALPPDEQTKAVKQLASLLEKQGVAYDIAGHRDAPPHLRIWGGATIETSDVRRCCPGSTGPPLRWLPRSLLLSKDYSDAQGIDQRQAVAGCRRHFSQSRHRR